MFYVPCVGNILVPFILNFCQALHFVFAFGMMCNIALFFLLLSQKYARIFTVILFGGSLGIWLLNFITCFS